MEGKWGFSPQSQFLYRLYRSHGNVAYLRGQSLLVQVVQNATFDISASAFRAAISDGQSTMPCLLDEGLGQRVQLGSMLQLEKLAYFVDKDERKILLFIEDAVVGPTCPITATCPEVHKQPTNLLSNNANIEAELNYRSRRPLIARDSVTGPNALHKAITRNDVDTVREIMTSKKGFCLVAHPDVPCTKISVAASTELVTKDHQERTPLISACVLGNIEIVRLLLENGPDMNARDPAGYSALHMATAYGHYDVVQYLLEKGIDCNLISLEEKQSAFLLASHLGQASMLPLFIQCPTCAIDLPERDGVTGLMQAITDSDLESLRSHLQISPALPNGSRNVRVKTLVAMEASASSSPSPPESPLLVGSLASLTPPSSSSPLLFSAAASPSLEQSSKKSKPQSSPKDEGNWFSPLHFFQRKKEKKAAKAAAAALAQHQDSVESFIDSSGDREKTASSLQLHLASDTSAMDNDNTKNIVDADMNEIWVPFARSNILYSNKEDSGRTPLHVAASFEYQDVLSFLLTELKNQFHVYEQIYPHLPSQYLEIRDAQGATPLHCAAFSLKPYSIRTLLSFGANIDAKDTLTGHTPLVLALSSHAASFSSPDDKSGKLEVVVRELLKAGADTSIQTSTDGQTALHIACVHNKVKIIRMLLTASSNVSIKNNANETPLDSCFNDEASLIVAPFCTIQKVLQVSLTTNRLKVRCGLVRHLYSRLVRQILARSQQLETRRSAIIDSLPQDLVDICCSHEDGSCSHGHHHGQCLCSSVSSSNRNDDEGDDIHESSDLDLSGGLSSAAQYPLTPIASANPSGVLGRMKRMNSSDFLTSPAAAQFKPLLGSSTPRTPPTSLRSPSSPTSAARSLFGGNSPMSPPSGGSLSNQHQVSSHERFQGDRVFADPIPDPEDEETKFLVSVSDIDLMVQLLLGKTCNSDCRFPDVLSNTLRGIFFILPADIRDRCIFQPLSKQVLRMGTSLLIDLSRRDQIASLEDYYAHVIEKSHNFQLVSNELTSFLVLRISMHLNGSFKLLQGLNQVQAEVPSRIASLLDDRFIQVANAIPFFQGGSLESSMQGFKSLLPEVKRAMQALLSLVDVVLLSCSHDPESLTRHVLDAISHVMEQYSHFSAIHMQLQSVLTAFDSFLTSGDKTALEQRVQNLAEYLPNAVPNKKSSIHDNIHVVSDSVNMNQERMRSMKQSLITQAQDADNCDPLLLEFLQKHAETINLVVHSRAPFWLQPQHGFSFMMMYPSSRNLIDLRGKQIWISQMAGNKIKYPMHADDGDDPESDEEDADRRLGRVFEIQIDRSRLIPSLTEKFMAIADASRARRIGNDKINIRFANETGVGKGVFREFLNVVASKIFKPQSLRIWKEGEVVEDDAAVSPSNIPIMDEEDEEEQDEDQQENGGIQEALNRHESSMTLGSDIAAVTTSSAASPAPSTSDSEGDDDEFDFPAPPTVVSRPLFAVSPPNSPPTLPLRYQPQTQNRSLLFDNDQDFNAVESSPASPVPKPESPPLLSQSPTLSASIIAAAVRTVVHNQQSFTPPPPLPRSSFDSDFSSRIQLSPDPLLGSSSSLGDGSSRPSSAAAAAIGTAPNVRSMSPPPAPVPSGEGLQLGWMQRRGRPSLSVLIGNDPESSAFDDSGAVTQLLAQVAPLIDNDNDDVLLLQRNNSRPSSADASAPHSVNPSPRYGAGNAITARRLSGNFSDALFGPSPSSAREPVNPFRPTSSGGRPRSSGGEFPQSAVFSPSNARAALAAHNRMSLNLSFGSAVNNNHHNNREGSENQEFMSALSTALQGDSGVGPSSASSSSANSLSNSFDASSSAPHRPPVISAHRGGSNRPKLMSNFFPEPVPVAAASSAPGNCASSSQQADEKMARRSSSIFFSPRRSNSLSSSFDLSASAPTSASSLIAASLPQSQYSASVPAPASSSLYASSTPEELRSPPPSKSKSSPSPGYGKFKPSAMFDDGYFQLFNFKGGVLHPKPYSESWNAYLSKDKYHSCLKAIGMVIASAVCRREHFNARFSIPTLSSLLGRDVHFDDLSSIDPDLHKQLDSLLQASPDMIDAYGLSFEADEEVDTYSSKKQKASASMRKTVELKAGGSMQPVTSESVHEFVEMYARFRMQGSSAPELASLAAGFAAIMPKDARDKLELDELDTLLTGGSSTIDLNDWYDNTDYIGYSESSLQVQWFWQLVQKSSEERRVQLLQFVTGSPIVPFAGFAFLGGSGPYDIAVRRFTIEKGRKGDGVLPGSRTCFNTLSLPDYSSADVMESKLLQALEFASQGFGLM